MKYKFSENIQRGIIYLLKQNKDFYVQICSLIKPEYFEFPSHSKIFTIITEYYEKYSKLPNDEFVLENIRETLGARENLSDYSDELEFINCLKDTENDREYYLDLIEKFAKNQAMKEAIAKSVELVKEGKTEQVEEVVRKALLINRNIDTGQDYFTDLSDRWLRMINQNKTQKYKTIFPSANKVLVGGLGKKEMGMVVAPAGVGKSIFLVNQAVQGLKEGANVLIVSLEMTEDKIAKRVDSVASLLPQLQLYSKQLKLKERLELFQKKFNSKLVIKQFPSNTTNVNTIKAFLSQLRIYDSFSPDIILIDYMDMMCSVKDCIPYQEQEYISRDLFNLAQEYNVLVWTATQTNREGKKTTIIDDIHLADCYGKIRPPDFVISLNQSREEYDEGRMRVWIMKARDGRKGFIIPMEINYETLRMKEEKEDDNGENYIAKIISKS